MQETARKSANTIIYHQRVLTMTDCGICLSGGEIDCYWEFQYHKIVKARKEHKCCECGRTISVGSKYEYFSGKIEGGMEYYHTCIDCANIRSGLACDDGSAWPAFGNLWSDITEVFDNLKSTACLTKIPTTSAKSYFLERWRKWKGLPA